MRREAEGEMRKEESNKAKTSRAEVKDREVQKRGGDDNNRHNREEKCA